MSNHTDENLGESETSPHGHGYLSIYFTICNCCMKMIRYDILIQLKHVEVNSNSQTSLNQGSDFTMYTNIIDLQQKSVVAKTIVINFLLRS